MTQIRMPVADAARADTAKRMTEKQLQAAVVELAQFRGYLVYHTHDSRHSQPGFPDLVLLRGGRLLFVELKSEKGHLTPEQKEWIRHLQGVAGIEVDVWRPSDWLDGSVEQHLDTAAV